MAKKAKTNRAKRDRRALKKRTERRQKQKRARQAAADAVAAANPRRIIRGARRMTPIGAWVESGWQEGVVARIVVAREMPSGNVLFAEFMADIRCLGVRDTRFYANLPREDFETEILPRLYSPDPPLEISNELANEIIWGAVEYAESLGFRPHRRFRDNQFALEPADALPRAAGVEFGYNGMPLYIPAPWDNYNQAAVVKTLINSVGLGNFLYQTPDGEIPDDVAEILGDAMDEMEEAEPTLSEFEQSLWVPGGVDAESGLWVPGMEGEDADIEEIAVPPREDAGGGQSAGALWTPGRD